MNYIKNLFSQKFFEPSFSTILSKYSYYKNRKKEYSTVVGVSHLFCLFFISFLTIYCLFLPLFLNLFSYKLSFYYFISVLSNITLASFISSSLVIASMFAFEKLYKSYYNKYINPVFSDEQLLLSFLNSINFKSLTANEQHNILLDILQKDFLSINIEKLNTLYNKSLIDSVSKEQVDNIIDQIKNNMESSDNIKFFCK